MVSLQMCAVETREGRVPTVGHGDASPRRRNALYQRVLSVDLRGHYSNLLSGKRIPSTDWCRRIAQIFSLVRLSGEQGVQVHRVPD